jgi:3-dehydroquinate synthase
MPALQQSFAVKVEYPVLFCKGVFQKQSDILQNVLMQNGLPPRKVMAVVDENLFHSQPAIMAQLESWLSFRELDLNTLPDIELIKGGEQVKNDPKAMDNFLAAMNREGLCRHSAVLALGGGAMLDAVGYACSIFHRGLRLIRMPSTVLSQNDSGVGVKNGINYFDKKNFLGTFTPPYAVVNDFEFLSSLPKRDRIAGCAEAVKVALLKDADFFEWIADHARMIQDGESAPMEQLIYRCAEFHMNHIGGSGDPYESGSSRPLDFGHWAAHKLEALSKYELRHGEAVGIGLALDCTYASMKGWISEFDLEKILVCLEELGLQTYHPLLSKNLEAPKGTPNILAGLYEFREHLGGELTLATLEKIGTSRDIHEVDLSVLKAAIKSLAKRNAESKSQF